MNNLEWIDKQILLVKENIQYHKDLLDESEEEYVDEIISTIKLLEPELQTLQQIKTILEAWEIVKKDFILTWESPNDASGYYLKYFGDIEYETIKKALEVEDE